MVLVVGMRGRNTATHHPVSIIVSLMLIVYPVESLLLKVGYEFLADCQSVELEATSSDQKIMLLL